MTAMKPLDRRQFTYSSLYFLLMLAALSAVQVFLLRAPQPRQVPYSELLRYVREHRVLEAEIRTDQILAKVRPAAEQEEIVVTSRLPGVEDTRLVEELERQNITFSGRIDKTPWWEGLIFGWILPMVLLMSFWPLVMRWAGRSSGPLTFGKSKVKIYDQSQAERVTFADVAGVDEAEQELVEVVDFLKAPAKYTALGARIPKGVLLVGPPGTGKTLLARAVAGEAGVPFFSISGSEFVEMFVGVGAARMRDLFEQAKQRAPCIVFIDELDAIGKSRGGLGALATHDEREQTLNQLLVEMDGFDSGSGVVIMSATNRPEVLDPALVRAGRFDRQVVVDRPDVGGREAILKVHARKVRLAPEVNLSTIARRTPGMVGADLANIVNEAALGAARRGAQHVEQQDLEEAIDRVQLGLKKRGRAMNEDEKRRVAVHEGGHAIVALSVEHADPVHRVTIIPRSIGALGVTLQLPTEDRYLMTRDELLDRLAVMLGGRAAEEVMYGSISTGAQNDLERATETARQMVCRFGMSDTLGPQTFGRPMGAKFLDTPVSLGEERNFSEETARAIDAEVKAILEQQHERARKILSERRDVLDALARRLLKDETLDREALDAIVGRRPEPAAVGIASAPAAVGR
jgi:cell division protease FtsH